MAVFFGGKLASTGVYPSRAPWQLAVNQLAQRVNWLGRRGGAAMLTDRQVKAVNAPAQGRLEVPDGESGVMVRVTTQGTITLGTWFRVPLKYGPDGGRGYLTFGKYPDEVSQAEARDKARAARKLASEGIDPQTGFDRRRREAEAARGLTVRAMVGRHLDARRAVLQPNTLQQYTWVARIVDESVLADRPLAELSRGEVKEVLCQHSTRRLASRPAAVAEAP